MTNLRLLRIMRELSIHALANAVGLNPSELSRVERKLLRPSRRIRNALERYFHIQTDELLEEADLIPHQ